MAKNIDVTNYVPEQLRDQGLWDQMIYIVNKIILDHETDFVDAVEKYSNIQSVLPVDLLERIIAEFGYGYISDVLTLDENRLRQLTQIMSIVNAMKGTKVGLLLVLSLIGFQGSETTEWWEKDPKGTPTTFDLDLNLDTAVLEAEAIPRLLQFIREYVYPTLETLTLISEVLDARIYALGARTREFYGTFADTVPPPSP